MRTETINIYKFDELSEAAQQKAIENLHDINVDHEWWDCTYDDAMNIGIKITSFDLGRAHSITGELQHSLNESCDLILKNHGEDCKTTAIAKRYLAQWSDLVEQYSDGVNKDTVLEENEQEFDDYADEMEHEFRADILWEYFNILEREYEYLTSEEGIKETIKSNEYEFTESGEMY